jgi:hypothetical protein
LPFFSSAVYLTNSFLLFHRASSPGLAYGLSHPLLAHLAHSNLSIDHSNGTEDARTGSWMPAVDERTRLGQLAGEEGKGKMVQWKDVGSMLGGEGPFDTQSPKCECDSFGGQNMW